MKTRTRIYLLILIGLGFVFIITNSCKKETTEIQLPVLTTSDTSYHLV